MSRVKQEVKFTNPVKSISAIPDHYVNVCRVVKPTSDKIIKAGTKIKNTFTGTCEEATGTDTWDSIVFSDQKAYANEDNTITVMIHGFVDKNKLQSNTSGKCTNGQITILGGE